jgi:ribose transport system substrate-binding protein
VAPAFLLATACSDGAPPGDSTVSGSQQGAKHHIAFFGFAKANSFASATFTGVKEYARAHGADAEFFDPNFDAQVQVRQMQDAITSKRFDAFLVQANDGAAVQPQVRAALKAGIPVVAVFTPVGKRFDTAEPQVPGAISLVDVPTVNGRELGELGVDACRSKKANPCNVAYLEGFKTLPLDNARTKAVERALKAAGPSVKLVAEPEGGYTQQSGRKAMQDVLQSAPDVDVVLGSSQAVAGAEKVARGKGIAFVGNGGSRQAVAAVKSHRWFGVYYVPATTMGAKAAELALRKADGKRVDESTLVTSLTAVGPKGTARSLKGVAGEYDE